MKTKKPTSPPKRNEETPTIMTWSLKAIIHPPRDRKLAVFFSFAAPGMILTYMLSQIDFTTIKSYSLPISMTTCMLLACFAMLKLSRQKTLFNYRLYPDHIESDECLYYPDYTENLFKGIVIVFTLATIFLGLFVGSPLIAIFGPVFILLGTGGALMSWQRPEPRRRTAAPWEKFNFITVDRKYRIIVQHCTDVTLGFEVRFPNNEMLEQYLAFLHTVLRSTVAYTEKVWPGSYQ